MNKFISCLLIFVSAFSGTAFSAGRSPQELLCSLKKAENTDGLIDLLVDSGSQLKKNGLWKEHIHFSELALERCLAKDRMTDYAKIATQVASTYFYQGNYQECRNKASRAYDIYAGSNSVAGQIACLYLLSAAERGLKNFDKSIAIAHAALAYFNEGDFEDNQLQAKVLFNLAAAYMDKDGPETAKAEELLTSCIILAEGAHDQDYALRASLRLCKTYLMQGKISPAKELLADLASRIPDQRAWMHYHYLFAQVLAKEGKKEEARKEALEAKQLAEHLQAKEDLARIDSFLSSLK